MESAAEAERFEEAARLRDRIEAVERTVERQQIVGQRRADRDVFGLARRGGDVEVQVLHVRDGRVVGAQRFARRRRARRRRGALLVPRPVLRVRRAADPGRGPHARADRGRRRARELALRARGSRGRGARAAARRAARARRDRADATPSSRSGGASRRSESVASALAELHERLGLARAAAPDRVLRRLDAARHARGREPRGVRGRPAAARATTAATGSARRRPATTTPACAR